MTVQHDPDPYFSIDTRLFDGVFRYFRSEPREVRGKAHQEAEAYDRRPTERARAPLTVLHGTCIYVHMKPFVLSPTIHLTIGLYGEDQQRQQRGAVGEVLGGRTVGHHEVEIGQAQAWYYPEDRLIELWECFLEGDFRGKDLAGDENMRKLWESFIQFLRGQFPGARKIATPFHDPLFETPVYQEFLRSLGFAPDAAVQAAFSKLL